MMPRWICSQLGAREHYAIPRALQNESLLERIYTDFRRPGLQEVNRELVTAFPVEGLRWWYRSRKTASYQTFIEQGEWFAKSIVKAQANNNVEGSIFFGYDTGFLEAARELNRRGAQCIVGQIDPGRVEFDLVAKERDRWPGWEDESPSVPEAYHSRRDAEWEVAEKIIVNSNWSREALKEQGVPGEKLHVVPLCFEPPKLPQVEKKHNGFVVLWLGQVNLRKGFPYFIEAARKLESIKNILFKVVGPISISRQQVSKAPGNVEFLGAVNRTRVSQIYRSADLFVLPTLSDGFAITQLEAMAHGLPVIGTSNCGAVVEDGANGFIVPIRDSDSISARILALAEDSDSHRHLSNQALIRSKQFTLERLARNLLEIVATDGIR